MGRATVLLFWPRPLGPWGGAKRSNIIKFQFQRLLNQTLCVFSRMKDIKHQMGFSFGHPGQGPGMGLGVLWGVEGVQKNFFSEIQTDLVCKLLT